MLRSIRCGIRLCSGGVSAFAVLTAIALWCRREATQEATREYPVTKYTHADAAFEASDPHASDLAILDAAPSVFPAPSASTGYLMIGHVAPGRVSWIAKKSVPDEPADRDEIARALRARLRDLRACRESPQDAKRLVLHVRYDRFTPTWGSPLMLGAARLETPTSRDAAECVLGVVRGALSDVGALPPGVVEIVLWL